MEIRKWFIAQTHELSSYFRKRLSEVHTHYPNSLLLVLALYISIFAMNEALLLQQSTADACQTKVMSIINSWPSAVSDNLENLRGALLQVRIAFIEQACHRLEFLFFRIICLLFLFVLVICMNLLLICQAFFWAPLLGEKEVYGMRQHYGTLRLHHEQEKQKRQTELEIMEVQRICSEVQTIMHNCSHMRCTLFESIHCHATHVHRLRAFGILRQIENIIERQCQPDQIDFTITFSNIKLLNSQSLLTEEEVALTKLVGIVDEMQIEFSKIDASSYKSNVSARVATMQKNVAPLLKNLKSNIQQGLITLPYLTSRDLLIALVEPYSMQIDIQFIHSKLPQPKTTKAKVLKVAVSTHVILRQWQLETQIAAKSGFFSTYDFLADLILKDLDKVQVLMEIYLQKALHAHWSKYAAEYERIVRNL